MKCNKKTIKKQPNIDRCNEMIKGFEDQINHMFKTNVKYKGEERKLLIKTIKDNPNHCWEVTKTGLMHYDICLLPKKVILDTTEKKDK